METANGRNVVIKGDEGLTTPHKSYREMKKNNLDHADMVFLTFLDKMCVHFAYWAIITLVYVLCSK